MPSMSGMVTYTPANPALPFHVHTLSLVLIPIPVAEQTSARLFCVEWNFPESPVYHYFLTNEKRHPSHAHTHISSVKRLSLCSIHFSLIFFSFFRNIGIGSSLLKASSTAFSALPVSV